MAALGHIAGFIQYGWAMPLWRLYARARRATVHKSVVFAGRPLIRCCRGGQLILGSDVKIISSLSANPVIGRRRTSLCVIAPSAELKIENNVGISGACICAARSVRIGCHTIIGGDVLIADTDFHTPLPEWQWSNAAARFARPIDIGRGCFIGARAVVLKGVSLGDGCVVAAGAVVTKSVPAEHLVFGNPAKMRPLNENWRHPV